MISSNINNTQILWLRKTNFGYLCYRNYRVIYFSVNVQENLLWCQKAGTNLKAHLGEWLNKFWKKSIRWNIMHQVKLTLSLCRGQESSPLYTLDSKSRLQCHAHSMDPLRLKIIQPSIGVHTFIDIFVCVEKGVERNTPSN